MALTALSLTSFTSNTDAASYTVPSFTLPANALLLLAVTTIRSGATPAVPTVTGWDQIATVTFNTLASPVQRVTLFRRMVGSPVTGTVVITCGATQMMCMASFVTVDGVDTSGTNGANAVVGAAVTDRLNGVQSVPLTLPGFGSPTNGAYYVVAKDTTSDVNPDTGWTEVHDILATPGSKLYTQVRATEDTAVEPTWFPSANADAAAIAIEITEQPAFTSVSRSVLAPWENLAGVTAARLSPWEAGGRVVLTRAEPYESLVSLIAARLAPWEAGGRVVSTRVEPWENLVGALATRLSPWEAEGLAVAARAVAIPWGAEGRVVASRAEPYESLVSLTATRLPAWESIGRVVVLAPGLWENLIGAGRLATEPWESLRGALRATTSPWEAGGLLLVARALAVPWETLGRVLSPAAGHPWESLALLSRAQLLQWEALLSLLRTGIDPWEALALARRSALVPWETEGAPPPPVISNGGRSYATGIRFRMGSVTAIRYTVGATSNVEDKSDA